MEASTRKTSITRGLEVSGRSSFPRHGRSWDLFDQTQQADFGGAHETRFACAHQLREEGEECAFRSCGRQHASGDRVEFARILAVIPDQSEESFRVIVKPSRRNAESRGKRREG